MNTLIESVKVEKIIGHKLAFTNVNRDDAHFICEMRNDDRKNKFLSSKITTLEKQVEWIDAYENDVSQAYFIINYKNKKIGTIRLYDVIDDTFTWGSWILQSGLPPFCAIESALMIYAYGFDYLSFDNCKFDVRKENARVVSFHLKMGAKILREDSLNYYFDFNKFQYCTILEKYKAFLKNKIMVIK